MTKILIVEDEPELAKILQAYLEKAGFEVLLSARGDTGLQTWEREHPDLVLLDLNLPGLDGLDVAHAIRRKSETPLIMVTARAEETDRILGLELGADDYVSKPFSPQELVSRVRAVLRRTQRAAQASGERPLVFDDLTVDPQKRLAFVRDAEITLTAREFDLLWTLARHPRQVFNRDQLLDLVWGISEYIDASTVTVHVRRLREKIEPDPSNPRYIQTVWGVGYKFEP